MSIRGSILSFVLGALLAWAPPLSAQAGTTAAGGKSGITCNLPESDAEALVILNNYYPGYWWDHTDLTIAVQAHPSATEEQLAAIQGAIATWSDVLDECFDGLITLTDVTGSKRKAADIVVHYVPPPAGWFSGAMPSAATTAVRTSSSARIFHPAWIVTPTIPSTSAG
jgi:hypothetical protein